MHPTTSHSADELSHADDLPQLDASSRVDGERLLRVNWARTAGWSSTPTSSSTSTTARARPARAHEVRLQGGDCTTEIFQ